MKLVVDNSWLDAFEGREKVPGSKVAAGPGTIMDRTAITSALCSPVYHISDRLHRGINIKPVQMQTSLRKSCYTTSSRFAAFAYYTSQTLRPVKVPS